MPEIKNLIIVGAGGCGREVLQWVKDINRTNKQWEIGGFLDDDRYALENKRCEISVISGIWEYQVKENDCFVCCIGNSIVRKEVVDGLRKKGARFTNIIHPTAVIADTCSIGENVIIYPYALVSANAVINNGCIINMYSSIAHDSELGEYCTISAHCDVTGNCRLGDRVFMGTSSSMVPGTRIGNDVYICAGSTVMTRIRDSRKVMGNPARMIQF